MGLGVDDSSGYCCDPLEIDGRPCKDFYRNVLE